ncbi:MFS transporter [Paraburkholderia xenovorans]|uniref:MFS transporter n=1 Tax=Paraburkholderia xenovorans TaxID=36873 RepID=UPI0038BA44BA
MIEQSLNAMPYDRARISRSRLLFATTVGNAMEFFDFTVFGYFALVIGKAFFSPLSSQGQLMSSVAAFGVGFLMRPIGGVLIGIYADRAGRRAAMTLTLTLMAIGVCMAGLVPTYEQIGIAAPIIMVLARLIQGFSAGGEVGPATTVLLEQAPSGSQAWYTSWQLASQGIGIGVGALFAATLTWLLPADALQAWGWRIPFLCGVAILPVGIMLRRQLGDLEAAAGSGVPVAEHTSLTQLMSVHGRNVAGGILLLMGGTVTAYMVLFFIPTYAIRDLKLGESASYACAVASGLVMAILAPMTGRIADKYGRMLPILLARLVLICSVYPAYAWLTGSPSIARLFTVLVGLTLLFTIQGAPSITLIPELFPKAVRATATGSIYSLGVAIFGGLTQLAALWLIRVTGNQMSPAIAMTFCVALSTLSLLIIRRPAEAA